MSYLADDERDKKAKIHGYLELVVCLTHMRKSTTKKVYCDNSVKWPTLKSRLDDSKGINCWNE